MATPISTTTTPAASASSTVAAIRHGEHGQPGYAYRHGLAAPREPPPEPGGRASYG
jgi:hypothetical protein